MGRNWMAELSQSFQGDFTSRWNHPKSDGTEFVPSKNYPTSVELLRLPDNLPEVIVHPLALFKIRTIVGGIDKEVGWLGTAQRQGDNVFIEDMFLFNQEVSGSHTEISIDGLSEVAMELLQKPNGSELLNAMRFWGHSHVDMMTYPSGQDNDQMHKFHSFGCNFFLRGIFNRRGEVNFSLYDWERGIAVHRMPWTMADLPLPNKDELREIRTALRAEMKSRVKVKSWTSGFKSKKSVVVTPPATSPVVEPSVQNEALASTDQLALAGISSSTVNSGETHD